MSTRKRIQQGFTLVEILIVVVILGILAAIVIPQFTSASESAKASSLVSQLQTIRSQLELYQIQHNGDYPAITAADWTAMTMVTDQNGTTYASVEECKTAGFKPYGPYLQQPPVNPFTETAAVGDSASDAVGWVYNQLNGTITAVIGQSKADALDLDNSNDITTYADGV